MNLRPLRVGDDVVYLTRYLPGVLKTPPWGEDTFDCYVVNRCDSLDAVLIDQLASELASANNDWIETFGRMSERLHDTIDEASVKIGRQARTGDGSPMTAWHDDIVTDAEVVGYIELGGHGYQSVKVVIVVGDPTDENSLRHQLEAGLKQNYS